MNKRTKGKWIAVHDHDKNFVEPEQETKYGDYIAYCSGQGQDIGIEEAAANCAFIAAAGTAADKIEQLGYNGQAAIETIPELLEACHKLLHAIEMQEGRETQELHIPQDVAWHIWSEVTQSAIAKAKDQS